MTRKLIIILFILPLISILLVSVTPFVVPVEVDSFEEFSNAKFGLPIPFIKQNLLESGAGGYEDSFPHKFNLHMDFLDKEPMFEFSLSRFFYSIGITYCSLLVVNLFF